MKASVKIRDGKHPLVRAKLPLNLVGIPALSKVSMGSSQELGLHLGTLFEVGPSCRFSYRPNDLQSPFCFTLKTGFGLWGSPDKAAVVMTAEFNLSSKGNPSFLLRFKPRAGDFSLHKEARSEAILGLDDGKKAFEYVGHDQNSVLTNSAHKERGNSILIVKENSFAGDGMESGEARVRVMDRAKTFDPESEIVFGSTYNLKIEGKVRDKQGVKGRKELSKEHGSDKGSDDGCVIVGVPEDSPQLEQSQGDQEHNAFYSQKQGLSSSLRGWSLMAHSSLPIGKQAVATIRWRLGIPGNLCESFTKFPQSFSLLGLPLLVMDKVSLESVLPLRKRGWSPSGSQTHGLLQQSEEIEELGRVAAMCGLMRRQMHLVHAENEVLKKTMEDMRAEMEYSGNFTRRLHSDTINDLLKQEENLLRAQKLDESQSKHKGYARTAANERKVFETRARSDLGKQDPLPDIKRETPASKKAADDKTIAGSSQASSSKLSEELKKALESATGA
ncbi:hypothetical protein O6H91_04G109300 [Diphasiastrum complanatum]|uniref:Uncharacterized protein n=1 Tax=Diphasiastrum complanatum TaxID=34168 RepID=A0ACC2E0I1_DIPCM|nr:hypothetical protein O6H91_04G109300 [Diphasiastrum complanatum]